MQGTIRLEGGPSQPLKMWVDALRGLLASATCIFRTYQPQANAHLVLKTVHSDGQFVPTHFLFLGLPSQRTRPLREPLEKGGGCRTISQCLVAWAAIWLPSKNTCCFVGAPLANYVKTTPKRNRGFSQPMRHGGHCGVTRWKFMAIRPLNTTPRRLLLCFNSGSRSLRPPSESRCLQEVENRRNAVSHAKFHREA